MANDIDARIQATIREFVFDLSALVREAALASVSQALGGPRRFARVRGRPRKTPAGAVAPRGSRRKAPKRPRSKTELEAIAGQLLAAIKNSPGSRMEQIGEGLGLSSEDLAFPLRGLLAAGAVRKRGQKRWTTYYPT